MFLSVYVAPVFNLRSNYMLKSTSAVLDEVFKERIEQEAKWGEQNHCPYVWLTILGEEVGEANKAVLESTLFAQGRKIRISKEKLIENKGCYREELIQIAAVAVAMVECLDRGEW